MKHLYKATNCVVCKAPVDIAKDRFVKRHTNDGFELFWHNDPQSVNKNCWSHNHDATASRQRGLNHQLGDYW